MNSLKKIIHYQKGFFYLLSMLILIGLQSCRTDKKDTDQSEVKKELTNQIQIITEYMDFQMVDTIPSGWNSFYYMNKSDETHFFLIDKYPEGKSIKDLEKEIAPVFQTGMDLITKGDPEKGFEAFNKLPEWFFQVEFVGGSGLVSPGHSSLTYVNLVPGYYIFECYVKMPGGMFHTSMGMTKPVIVSEILSKEEKPKATVEILISSSDGIVFNDSISSGSHVFSVYFKDQIVHENFVGHDVNLVKLDENADIEVLEKWMNWADPNGLISPAPKGFTFLGGVNDMPVGHIGFFNVHLDQGNYVLISEVPNAMSKNMLKSFKVP